jgi:hypothetical protein
MTVVLGLRPGLSAKPKPGCPFQAGLFALIPSGLAGGHLQGHPSLCSIRGILAPEAEVSSLPCSGLRWVIFGLF